MGLTPQTDAPVRERVQGALGDAAHPKARARGPSAGEALLALQRRAGNTAVTALLTGKRDQAHVAVGGGAAVTGTHGTRGRARQVAPAREAGARVQARRLLALKAWAGNRVVSGVLRTVQPQEAARASTPSQQAGSAPSTASADGRAVIDVGRPLNRVGLIDNDLVAGGGVNLRRVPSTEGNEPIDRLPHNQQVLILTEHPGNWFRVVATTGADGFVTGAHLRHEQEMPDPGSVLHRIAPGETAFDIVHRHYGVDNMKAGSDARFYSNVLVYSNEERRRNGIRRPTGSERLHMFQSTGPGRYLDAWTVAGAQIWLPSKPWADTLKGTISAGSFSRDAWEKVKSLGRRAAEALVKIPAFVGGLIVGVVESLVDMVKALIDLVKSIVTGSIVDDVKAIVAALADKTMRQRLLHALADYLQARWNHSNPLTRWYWRGYLIGYVVGEVLGAMVTAGAGAALKASKYGVKFASLVKGLKPVQAAMTVASRVRASKAATAIGNMSGAVSNLPGTVVKKVIEAVKTSAEKLGRGKGTHAARAGGAVSGGAVISVFHGTGQKGLHGIGGLGRGRINVTHTGGAHQDLGRGFYLASDRTAAEHYAKARGRGGLQHVMQWDLPVDKLGVVVDVRPGGNFARQFDAFLERPFAGGLVPDQPDYRTAMTRQADSRGVMFDEFLDSIGHKHADTVIAPLGTPPFTGIGSGTQVSIRSQQVADTLNDIISGVTR